MFKKILKKDDPNVWKQLKKREIEKIVADLDDLPDLVGLSYQVNEFKNSMKLLKKGKVKESVIKNIHARAQALDTVFQKLQKVFKDVRKESAEVQEIEKFINENFLVLEVNCKGGKFSTHFSSDDDFVLGTVSIPILPQTDFFFEMFRLTFKKGKIILKQVGIAHFLVKDKRHRIVADYRGSNWKPVSLNLDEEYSIIVSVDRPSENSFSFSVSKPKDEA